MQAPEGWVVLAGFDLANGWAGFIDGAIESGFRAARRALAQRCARPAPPAQSVAGRTAAPPGAARLLSNF